MKIFAVIVFLLIANQGFATNKADCEDSVVRNASTIIEVRGLEGYDRGEAIVIAEDPAVRRFLGQLNIAKATIGRIDHMMEYGGYESVTTEVSVWERTYKDGQYVSGQGDFPLTFYVHMLPTPREDGSRYDVTSWSFR